MKIVYWSGTGNTEKMANLIAEGIVEKGKQAEVLSVEGSIIRILWMGRRRMDEKLRRIYE